MRSARIIQQIRKEERRKRGRKMQKKVMAMVPSKGEGFRSATSVLLANLSPAMRRTAMMDL